MARPASKQDDGTPTKDLKRVPVRMDDPTHDKLREMAVVWFREPIELLAGKWLRERIDAEYKKGRQPPPKAK